MSQIVTPQELGLNDSRWQHAVETAKSWCADERIPAASLIVGRGDKTTPIQTFGKLRLGDDAPEIDEETIFLIASITKPIVAMAAMLLVERGQLLLSERVSEIIPEFGGKGRYGISVRHLLTHTSGLPDMLPNNMELRQAHATTEDFVAETCKATPEFTPGHNLQYQSKGFAMLGEIIKRVSGQSCPEFLQNEFFGPMGMNDTALGAPESWFTGSTDRQSRFADLRLPPDVPPDADWHWNTRYWRTLGAPWGGILTTTGDLARYAQMILNQGLHEGLQILSPQTVSLSTRNHLETMPNIPDNVHRSKPWGLGWKMLWPHNSSNFGDLLSSSAYGHWGASGTLIWIDPELDAFGIILTTEPQEPYGYYLARMANMLVASFEPHAL